VCGLLWCSLLVASAVLLFPSNIPAAVAITVLVISLVIDTPYLILEFKTGRTYAKNPNTNRAVESMVDLPEKLQRILYTYYIFMDIWFILMSPVPLVFWFMTSYTQASSIIWFWIAGFYVFALTFSITFLVARRERRLTAICVPYFLGVFISRVILYVMKKLNVNAGFKFHKYI